MGYTYSHTIGSGADNTRAHSPLQTPTARSQGADVPSPPSWPNNTELAAQQWLCRMRGVDHACHNSLHTHRSTPPPQTAAAPAVSCSHKRDGEAVRAAVRPEDSRAAHSHRFTAVLRERGDAAPGAHPLELNRRAHATGRRSGACSATV